MKRLLIVLGIVLTLAIPFTAFAATSDTPTAKTIRSFCGIDASKLTDQQKADLNNQFNKMIELKKETVNKMVADGSLTKEDGDAQLKRIDEMAEYRQENGFTGGCGMGRGIGGGRGAGRGLCGNTNN